mgnify:CR=1 FL=1
MFDLTHHIIMKTFASTVLICNDVHLEIASELLVHCNINTTKASYGKIVQNSVSKEISRISN